ncbi:hypothetical protein KKE68_04485 [Patescibacteria group bacterium]|nr:hypothetical protein [Patescibacteria group bacterium]
MPETAKPLFFIRGKAIRPVSKTNKFIIAFIIFAVAYLSGKVPIFDDLSMTKKTQVLVEATTTEFSSKNNPELPEENTQKFQIRQISIGQNKFIPPTPTSLPSISGDSWGVAKKIGVHTYTMRLQSDSRMGTPEEILGALNKYRQQHGRGILAWDDKLAGYANTRAEYFSQKNDLDAHAGFLDYLNNQDGFKKLGFANIGENSSIGFTLEAVHIIEWVYAGDAEHNDNQLNNNWHYAGIGVNGNATDLIFAGKRL